MKIPTRLLWIALLATASAGVWCAPVNLNSADATTLAHELKGIGSVKAQAIVDYRQKHGAFRSVDELAQVRGISQKLIDRNRAELRVERVASAAAGGAAAPAARPAARPTNRGSAQH